MVAFTFTATVAFAHHGEKEKKRLNKKKEMSLKPFIVKLQNQMVLLLNAIFVIALN
ncbi:hypothetical protein [Capnocytophaga gingivalis]